MGNLATSDLPTLSTFTMEMTVLPMVVALWFYSDSQMSWALATSLVLVYEIGICFCFNMHSPFALLSGLDLLEGVKILGVLVILNLVYALTGSFIAWLLDAEEVLPFSACFPTSFKKSSTRGSNGDANELRVKVTGLNRWDMVNLPKPYTHTLITSILFAITVGIPHIIYAFFMDDIGSDNNIALACAIVIPLVGYVLSLIYWYFWPDPYVWGPQVKNFKLLGARYAGRDSKDQVRRDTKLSNMRIYKTVLMFGIMHFIGIVVLGSVRYTHMDIDWNWLFAAVLVAVMVLVSLISYGALYIFRGKDETEITVFNATGGDALDDEVDIALQEADNSSEKVDVARFYSSPQQQISHRLNAGGFV